jgi:hypothetical protein
LKWLVQLMLLHISLFLFAKLLLQRKLDDSQD